MVDDHNPTEFLLRNVWMRIDDREAARVDMAESCRDPEQFSIYNDLIGLRQKYS